LVSTIWYGVLYLQQCIWIISFAEPNVTSRYATVNLSKCFNQMMNFRENMPYFQYTILLHWQLCFFLTDNDVL
jgi:hypothetical protein